MRWAIMCMGVLLISTACAVGDEITRVQTSDYYYSNRMPRSRADNIPQEHVMNMCDEYMTGYVQALIDMHYYEFEIRTIMKEGIVYVFNLPKNELISYSILCFIHDIPGVQAIQRVNCCPTDFIRVLSACKPRAAREIAASQAYLSMCQQSSVYRLKCIWLPQNTVLFLPFIADPRQVMNAASLRFNDNVIGKHVGAISFGDEFVLLRLMDILWWRGDMDLGIEAGVFSVFDLDHIAACMVNTDFFVAALITYAIDKWSFRLRFWHMSSHLGDEFLLAYPTVDRRNLSDEGVDIFASYQIGQAVRIYAGIGDIYSRDEEFPEDPLYIEFGSEIRVFGGRDCFNRLYIQPFLAMHFRAWEEQDFDLDQTYALGVEWSKIQGVGRKFRIFFEYHNGYSKEGQFCRERSNYFSIKANYSF